MLNEISRESGDYQIKIPNELIQFLEQETYSLLIKGNAGTGKTTLALCILKELGLNKNCLYISTRISPEQIYQYYPWVEKFFNRPIKTELEDLSEDDDQSIFVDARLDELNTLFERITNELMDVSAPTIIIDTWDAVGFSMDQEALKSNAKVLQTWRERAHARLIFVVENPEDTTFDFLVDGIVELRQKQINERMIREIYLSKLRGVRINKPSYVFSVNNTLFHSYDHYHPSHFADTMYFPAGKIASEKKSIKNRSHFTTGYQELDKLLGGGFPVGSTVSVEFESQVNAKIVLAFLSKIIVNFISNQNMVLFQPFERSGSELLNHYRKSFGSQKDLVQFFPAASSTKSNITKKTDQHLRKIQQIILAIKKKYQKKQLLSILGQEMADVSSITRPDRNYAESLSFIKSHSDLSIFIWTKLPDNKHTYISQISDIRLRILEIDGTIFLQSDTPWSPLYAIVASSKKGQGIKLEPIV